MTMLSMTPWFADGVLRTFFDSPELTGPAADALRVDVLEKDGEVQLVCDLPGATPDDVDITFENGTLTVAARRNARHDGAKVHLAERFAGTISRSFRLSDACDPDRISATLHNGVLCVHVPKRPEAMPKKVPIYFQADSPAKQLQSPS